VKMRAGVWWGLQPYLSAISDTAVRVRARAIEPILAQSKKPPSGGTEGGEGGEEVV
jgi:hypothetical protein